MTPWFGTRRTASSSPTTTPALAGHPELKHLLQAQVIALHYYEDSSVAQVAAALGKAPGTIKAQLHHGRRKLARLLGAETDPGRPR